MKMSRATAGLGAVLAVAGSLFAGVPAASAAGTGTACPTDRFCLYFNSDFGGARADYAYSDAGLGNELFTDGPQGRSGWGVQVNNNAASAINHTGKNVAVYYNSDCSGTGFIIYPGERWNLASFGMKNQVSSLQVAGSACIYRDQSWA
jgi:hypothetical protein